MRDTAPRRTLLGVALAVLLITLVLLIPWHFTAFRTQTFRWLLWRELP